MLRAKGTSGFAVPLAALAVSACVCPVLTMYTTQGRQCDVVQGHALYYGRGELADEYFDKLGYTLPYRVNVADFILDLSSADVYTEGRYCPPD